MPRRPGRDGPHPRDERSSRPVRGARTVGPVPDRRAGRCRRTPRRTRRTCSPSRGRQAGRRPPATVPLTGRSGPPTAAPTRWPSHAPVAARVLPTVASCCADSSAAEARPPPSPPLPRLLPRRRGDGERRADRCTSTGPGQRHSAGPHTAAPCPRDGGTRLADRAACHDASCPFVGARRSDSRRDRASGAVPPAPHRRRPWSREPGHSPGSHRNGVCQTVLRSPDHRLAHLSSVGEGGQTVVR